MSEADKDGLANLVDLARLLNTDRKTRLARIEQKLDIINDKLRCLLMRHGDQSQIESGDSQINHWLHKD